jgi:hypothetical protein
MDRGPHIGEYVAKTNAIRDFSHTPAAPNQAENGPEGGNGRMRCRLLPVVFQHLIAGFGQFRTILLKAGQNGEITLIYHGTAVALYVARTSCLLLRSAAALLLGHRTGGNGYRQQGQGEEKLMHCVPSL